MATINRALKGSGVQPVAGDPPTPDEAPAKDHKEPGKAPVRDPSQRA